MNKLELKIPPPIIFTLTVFLIYFSPKSEPTELRTYAALFFLSLGIFLLLIAVIQFFVNRTTVDPRDPSKSTTLVTNGIYRFTRNPIYLGFLILLISLSFYCAHWLSVIYCACFYFYITELQIKPEERFLTEKFGEDYRNFLKNVRRWI